METIIDNDRRLTGERVGGLQTCTYELNQRAPLIATESIG
jgi:hypothetical protein